MKVPDGDRKFSPDTGTYSRQPRPCAARPPQPDDHRRGAYVGVSARTSRRSPVVLPEGPATAAHQRALLRAPARVPLARAARGTRGGRSPMATSVRLVVRVVFVPAGGARATRGAGSPKVLLRAASAAAPSEARAARVRREHHHDHRLDHDRRFGHNDAAEAEAVPEWSNGHDITEGAGPGCPGGVYPTGCPSSQAGRHRAGSRWSRAGEHRTRYAA